MALHCHAPLAPPLLLPPQTLCCANTQHDQFLQVTATQVRLVDSMTLQLAAQWEAGAAGRITIASSNPSQARADAAVYFPHTLAAGRPQAKWPPPCARLHACIVRNLI